MTGFFETNTDFRGERFTDYQYDGRYIEFLKIKIDLICVDCDYAEVLQGLLS